MKVISGFVQPLPTLLGFGWGTTMVVSKLTEAHADKPCCLIGPSLYFGVTHSAGISFTTKGILIWNENGPDGNKLLHRPLSAGNTPENLSLQDAIKRWPNTSWRIWIAPRDSFSFTFYIAPVGMETAFTILDEYNPAAFAFGYEMPAVVRAGVMPAADTAFLKTFGVVPSIPVGSEITYG